MSPVKGSCDILCSAKLDVCKSHVKRADVQVWCEEELQQRAKPEISMEGFSSKVEGACFLLFSLNRWLNLYPGNMGTESL